MAGPKLLDGLLVLDFARVLAGPFAAMVLADLGARVLKIEPPTGDEARGFGPFVDGTSLYYVSVNRGKEGIALDLRQPAAREAALALAVKADVLIENFRPGAMGRLGLGYEQVSAVNPRLVYCSLSGFGHYGPKAGQGAYDVIIQAVSGLMSLTGPEGGPPVRVGASVGDLIPALYAVTGILGALYRRGITGQGCFVDLAMQDAVVSVVENALARAWATGEDPGPLGSRHPTIAPFAAFPTADGAIAIGAGNNALFERLCAVLGAPHLPQDARFATNAARVTNVDALHDELAALLADHTSDDWLAALQRAGVPAGKVARMSDLLLDEHLQARNMILHLDQPGVGRVPMPGIPIKAKGYDDTISGPAPSFGQDGPRVLQELLGYSSEQIEVLIGSGAVLSGAPRSAL